MTTEILSDERADAMNPRKVAFAESVVEVGGGVKLCLRVAQVTGPIRADVLLTHGLGEHTGRYAHVAAALAGRGIRLLAYDLRGHGRSSGRRGDVERYEDFLDDLCAVSAQAPWSGRPVFLFGHSLGGQVTLRHLQRDRPAVAGAIVASPWLRLAFEPPRWKVAVARVAMRFAPGLRFATGMRLDRLSRDTEHVRAITDSGLTGHRISARMFFAVSEAGELALREAHAVQVPLLLLHGDADPITHWRTTEEFSRQPGPTEKMLKIYPGVLHEAHNDVGRDQVLRDIADWIESRLKPGALSKTRSS
jgi:alpha-beta hydrolase superfamily lysophospholipase